MSVEASHSFLLLGGTAVAAFIIHAYLTYRRNLRAVGNTPGLRSIVSLTRLIRPVIPGSRIPFTNWFFSVARGWWSTHKYETFRTYGQDIISGLSLDLGVPTLVIADAEAAQEVLSNRARFSKPVELYAILDLYGPNIVTTENEAWRRHRRISASSFSESNNILVCEETVLVLRSLFESWEGRPVVECNLEELTFASALMVICSAGFGKRTSWVDVAPPAGYKLTFKNAIETVSRGLFLKVAVPNFAMGLTARTSRIQLGFSELNKYIMEMIRDRKNSYINQSDLFSNLIAANEQGDKELRLSEQEVIGDVFTFLIAGHENTAHTLAFAIGLLALYPEVQEKLYHEVTEVVSDPFGAPTYPEIAALTFATAILYETLRLYPSVSIIPKRSVENTTLRTRNSNGDPVVVPIPKGSSISVNVPAIHNNPKYWTNPDQFQPERFLGDWPKHAFIPFSIGARSCIGRRFAEVEAIVEMSMLVKNYHIQIPTGTQFAWETPEQKRARVLAHRDLLTLTPKNIPVILTRR